MANYGNYCFRDQAAARLASLSGIQEDLLGVISYCDLLTDNSYAENFNTLEWEAVSSAAVVRYARSFARGARQHLSRNLLQSAGAQRQQLHDFVILVRHKHFAHSVNDFEENDVTLQIGDHFESAEEIEHVNTYHGRSLGLPVGMPSDLKDLAGWLLARIEEEIASEKQRILEIARRRSLKELRRHGIPRANSPSGNVGRRRKRP